MDADDLARGRELLERSRDTTGSWQDWQIAGHHWQSWLATNAAALLDAAERAARLEAALLSRSFPLEDWGRIEFALKHIVRNDLVDDDAYDAYDALYERVKAFNRAALEQPKGDGGE